MLSIHTLPQTIIVCHSTYLSSYYFLIQTYITLLLIYYYLSHFIDLFCLFYLSFFLCLNKLVINWPSPRVLSFCHSVRARLCDSLHQVIGTFCLHDFSHFSHRQVLLKHWYREFEIKKKIASMFLLLFLLMCTCDLADVFPCSSAKTSNITPIKKAMNMTVSLTSLLSDCQLNTQYLKLNHPLYNVVIISSI